MLAKKVKEVYDTPAGSALDRLVEVHVVGRDCCQCLPVPKFRAADKCLGCGRAHAEAWSTDRACSQRLLDWAGVWGFHAKRRFTEALGACLTYRLGGGRISPEHWILLADAADIARAAVLASAK